MQFVEAALRRAGARILIIEASGVGSSAATRAFYGKLGYHEEGRVRRFYGRGEDKVVLWKEVGSSVPPPRTGEAAELRRHSASFAQSNVQPPSAKICR